MPIPFLLAGLAVGAGVLGVGGHISAKDTNERAQRLSEDAQDLYNSAKHSLEQEQNNTEKALLKLGYAKKKILDSSMKQFLEFYNKIKHIQMTESSGINEILKFTIDQQAAIELREMTDIYSSTFKSGATGVAAGAVVALAVNGSLSVVMGGLTTAGTALMVGEVSAATGIAGSALSFGAAMTPLAAVAAPLVLFTGISASMKADENLEKAKAMYAQAEFAAEKMKVSETLCVAITDKSEMFDELLEKLDEMFLQCTSLLAGVIRKKEGRIFKKIFKKKLTSSDFSENDIKLIAVTRALAGSIKAVIDTPMLSKDGSIAYESKEVYDTLVAQLEDFDQKVEEIQQIDFNAKPIVPTIKNSTATSSSASSNSGTSILRGARNVFAMIVGFFVASGIATDIALRITQVNMKVFFINSLTANTIAIWFLSFALISMIIGKFGESLFKNIMIYGSGISLTVLYYEYCRISENLNYPIITAIVVFIVGAILLTLTDKINGSIKGKYLYGISVIILCAPIMFIAYYFLGVFIGLFPRFILGLSGVILFASFVGMAFDEKNNRE